MTFIASFAVLFLQTLLRYNWVFQALSFHWPNNFGKAGLKVYFMSTAQRYDLFVITIRLTKQYAQKKAKSTGTLFCCSAASFLWKERKLVGI